MTVLLLGYAVYLLLFGLVSYAVIYHLTHYRVQGDLTGVVLWAYAGVSAVIIISSFIFLKPV